MHVDGKRDLKKRLSGEKENWVRQWGIQIAIPSLFLLVFCSSFFFHRSSVSIVVQDTEERGRWRNQHSSLCLTAVFPLLSRCYDRWWLTFESALLTHRNPKDWSFFPFSSLYLSFFSFLHRGLSDFLFLLSVILPPPLTFQNCNVIPNLVSLFLTTYYESKREFGRFHSPRNIHLDILFILFSINFNFFCIFPSIVITLDLFSFFFILQKNENFFGLNPFSALRMHIIYIFIISLIYIEYVIIN